MNDERKDFWFPAKRFGWGWGMPVRWQGWVVMAGYFGLVLLGIPYVKATRSTAAFLIYAAIVTAVLVVVIYLKGESPRWRWNGK
jgi:hypothetical protein